MKKLFFILAIGLSGLFIACNNATEKTEKEVTADSSNVNADSLSHGDPAHGMGPLDTLGRRPRD